MRHFIYEEFGKEFQRKKEAHTNRCSYSTVDRGGVNDWMVNGIKQNITK